MRCERSFSPAPGTVRGVYDRSALRRDVSPRARGACAIGLVFGSGCSWVYDFGVFEGVETDAAPMLDADFSQLALDSLEPPRVLEGTGCVTEGAGCGAASRGAVIVIHGANISADATVTLDGYGGVYAATPVALAGVSTAHDMAAFALPIPVDPALPEGEDSQVTVKVSQVGVEAELTLQIGGLDELVSSVAAPAGMFDIATLDPIYSRITIDTALELRGDVPARFVATGDIAVDAAINANGVGNVRRAGGCLGGPPQAPGQCGGGGAGGTNTAGGGGGGNSDVGTTGQGTGGGMGGAKTSAVLLVPLSAVQGNGGGGGGGSVLGSQPGGGGGGVVELTAGGALSIGASGRIDVHGAAGGMTGLCSAVGGAGGGGSGGAILLRAATELTIVGAAGAVLDVGAGLGGTASGACAGGAGSAGLVRADAVSIDDPMGELGGQPLRGAIWTQQAPAVVTADDSLSLTLAGAAGVDYFSRVGTADPVPVELQTETGQAAVTLQPGLNNVCLLVIEDGSVSQPESLNCLAIAYLP